MNTTAGHIRTNEGVNITVFDRLEGILTDVLLLTTVEDIGFVSVLVEEVPQVVAFLRSKNTQRQMNKVAWPPYSM